ncbi:hypothetical protein [Streptomyces cinnamoneus]|uniref:hypothetical protein n=1 Tax=Streptomyces cinnamoneus TaxID=53446 RepID=UPI0037B49793
MAVLTAYCLVWSPPAQAHGHGPEAPITCLGTYQTAWTPGLSLVPRPTRISTTETYTCTGPSGRTTRAAGRFEGTLTASCLQVSTAPFREVVRFDDGHESTIEYTANLRARAGAVSLTKLEGSVIAGRAKGHHAFRTAQLLHRGLPTACLAPGGLREGAGLAQLVIASG